MQRKRNLALIIATLLCIPVLSVVPVAAEDSGSGSGGSGSSGSGDSSTATTSGDHTTTTTSGDSTTTSGDKISTGDSKEPEPENEMGASETDHIKQEAKAELETLRENHQEKSVADRQKACEARQAEINARIGNYSAAAQRHLNVFTDILTKVENFYSSKKLNVSSYDSLLATAQAKQTAAQQAVDTLKGLDVSIDCTQPDPAQSLEAVKTAVGNARTALQAYRSAIKDVIVALEGASTANESTTGGNQ